MSRDGSGVYSVPAGTRVNTLTTVASAPYNALIDDLETDANTDRPVVAGGTGASTAAGARANLGVRNLKAIDTTGSSNTYAVTTTDSLTPSDGDQVIVIANHTNSGAATLNVDTTGAVAIKKMVGGTATALAAGDIVSGEHYLLSYDSGEAAWLLFNPANLYKANATISGNLTVSGDVAADLTFQTGSGNDMILDEIGASWNTANAEAFDFANTGAGSVDLQVNGDSVVSETAAQTLTNKTLTDPVISQIVSVSNGDITLDPNGTGKVVLNADVAVNNSIFLSTDLTTELRLTAGVQQFYPSGVLAFTVGSSGGTPYIRVAGAGPFISSILDEDSMATNSATALATQQSIKAYVDNAAPWTGATGEILYDDGSGPAALALGNAREFVRANSAGSGLEFAANHAWAGSPVTLTGATDFDFESIPAGCYAMMLMAQGVSTGDTSPLRILLGDAGGVETSGYTGGYRYASVAAGAFSTSFLLQNASAASSVYDITAEFYRMHSSTHQWAFKASVFEVSSGVSWYSEGYKTLTAEITTIRLGTVAAANNLDAGTANALYFF